MGWRVLWAGETGWSMGRGCLPGTGMKVQGAKNSPVLGRQVGKAQPWGWGQQLGLFSYGAVLETVQ